MTDHKHPVGYVLTRNVPRLTAEAGLPTAHSRVDIFESKAVSIPLLQPDNAADEPSRPDPTPDRNSLIIKVAIVVVVVVAVIAYTWVSY